MRKSIVLSLLLVSCGAAVASPPGVSTGPDPTTTEAPTSEPTAAPTTSTTSTTVSLTTPPTAVTTDAQAASTERLVATTKAGQIITFSPDAPPVATTGVAAPGGHVVVSASVHDDRTTVQWHELRTDEIIGTQEISGNFHPTAVAQDGDVAALIDSKDASTTIVLASRSKGEVRRWRFGAVLVPEMLNFPGDDGVPSQVFALEYLATRTYRVRAIDTSTGQLGLPLNLRDKSQTVDDVMTAVSRTAVFESVHQLLFTLYQDATEDGANVGSFIHTLGWGVWCLDVPEQLGLADHPGALAVSPDGAHLYVASSTGGVAAYVVDDVTNQGSEMPKARRVVDLGSSDAGHAAIGASRHEVVVALDGSIFRLDPDTLALRDKFTWDMSVEALTVHDDGSIVIVGTGRMTMVSPGGRVVAERVLPPGTGEITRVAVVG